ncbi:MAG: hypothetical protein NTY46_11375 [Candidatus Sumerlaeota bacterium]|nr:hypothetical protein [Candidatus Sumerlaeota bacterium]
MKKLAIVLAAAGALMMCAPAVSDAARCRPQSCYKPCVKPCVTYCQPASWSWSWCAPCYNPCASYYRSGCW